MKERVFLIGMPGSGKTDVGAVVAAGLGVELVDLDERIEDLGGCTITELVAAQGEVGLRALERDALTAVTREASAVVATGGGTILDDRNIADMRAWGVTVWLDVPVEVLADRVEFGATRPLLTRAADLELLFAERTPLYAAAADVRVDGLGSVDEVAEAVLDALRERA